jgi:hypothetical protein
MDNGVITVRTRTDATMRVYIKHSYQDLNDARLMDPADWPRSPDGKREEKIMAGYL